MHMKTRPFGQNLVIVCLLFISSLIAIAWSPGFTVHATNHKDTTYHKVKPVVNDGHFHEDPNTAHTLPFSGTCVPGTTNRFSGSWHSNLYIGNNNGTNALLGWGQNMSTYLGLAAGNLTSPTVVTGHAGVPYEVKSSSSGVGTGYSALALRTSTNLYFFGTAANLTGVTTMAAFGGATLTTAASNVTAKLPAGVAITDIAEMQLSQTAFAIVTNAGHVYVLTTVANLQGDQAAANAATWHHVTLTGGVTPLTGVTKLSLSSSGAFAMTSTNKIYYWGAPANVAGVTNTATSYNYAFDMSAQIPAGRIVIDLVCQGTKIGPSPSTLFILCNNRKVYSCGVNTFGCLGINNATTTFNQGAFITVKGTDGITDLSGIIKIDGATEGDVYCMGAISNTGQVFGWGDSPAGMLGTNASTSSVAVPKTVQLFSPTPGLNYNDFSVAGHFIIAFYSQGATDQYWYLGHNVGGSVGDPANATAFILAASPASLSSSGGITYECSNVFLPLTWLSFNAQKQAGSVSLNWSTANEINTNGFQVQYRTDANTWQTIGSVPAAGNSSSTQHYSFVHNDPAKGINYYRLLQQDIDGHSSYSKTLNVVYTSKTNLVILYSNRITNGILELQLEEAATINIYNSVGALVLQQKLPAGRQTLNTGNLTKGTYILKAGTESKGLLYNNF